MEILCFFVLMSVNKLVFRKCNYFEKSTLKIFHIHILAIKIQALKNILRQYVMIAVRLLFDFAGNINIYFICKEKYLLFLFDFA